MFFKNPGILGDYAKAIFCLKGASTAEREFRKMVPSLLELSLKRVHDITVACPVLLDQVAATAGIKDLLFTSSDQTIWKRTVQCLSKFCINLDECAQIVVADKRIFPLSLDLLKDSLLKTDRQLKHFILRLLSVLLNRSSTEEQVAKLVMDNLQIFLACLDAKVGFSAIAIFMHLGGSKEKLRQIMAFRLAETGKTFFRVMSKEMLNVATYYYRIKTTRSRLPYATAVLRICALCLKLDGVDLREEVEEAQLWFHASIFLWKECTGEEDRLVKKLCEIVFKLLHKKIPVPEDVKKCPTYLQYYAECYGNEQ